MESNVVDVKNGYKKEKYMYWTKNEYNQQEIIKQK